MIIEFSTPLYVLIYRYPPISPAVQVARLHVPLWWGGASAQRVGRGRKPVTTTADTIPVKYLPLINHLSRHEKA